ncbi:hypothetical protein D3H64_02060 [Atopobacter sp. AH10]|uniref:hypothetical protein n=1 Tax=Atopobacter sp. AH10 TaxID=2315861 RepID=UPI000EF25B63|nr:hypothetical protein [Atopobacter sp. AH10]RLK63885.1 hypothetical protein D3H64_02060 [Atopobacter sp. AH10]
MILNTLGPTTTDCYHAISYVKSKIDEIRLYSSFDRMIENIDHLKGQYILMPLAFESSCRAYGWKDFNYEYYRRLNIVELFHAPIKEMVLVENKPYKMDKAIIQPATQFLMLDYLSRRGIASPIDFAPSKAKAKNQWEDKGYRFAIVSKDALDDEDRKKICESYSPEMIWCLYEVK